MNIKPLVIGDLKAKFPLIQGGMGVGISLSGLAGAVAKSGTNILSNNARNFILGRRFHLMPYGTYCLRQCCIHNM